MICLVRFHGISTTVGYLMPNLVYTHKLNKYIYMICKHILLKTFINICLNGFMVGTKGKVNHHLLSMRMAILISQSDHVWCVVYAKDGKKRMTADRKRDKEEETTMMKPILCVHLQTLF